MTESQKEEERRSRRNDERGERTDKVTTMSSQAQFIQLYVYVDGNFPKPRIRVKARAQSGAFWKGGDDGMKEEERGKAWKHEASAQANKITKSNRGDDEQFLNLSFIWGPLRPLICSILARPSRHHRFLVSFAHHHITFPRRQMK